MYHSHAGSSGPDDCSRLRPIRAHDLALVHLRCVINLCTYLLTSGLNWADIQGIRDKNVGVVKDKFLLQKYTRLHSFKYEFSNIFWGEAHQEWRIYPLAKSAMPPLAKKFVFHHRKIGKTLAPVAYNRNFHQTINFLATPPHNDMVDFNEIKTFLFHLKMHQNRCSGANWEGGWGPSPQDSSIFFYWFHWFNVQYMYMHIKI